MPGVPDLVFPRLRKIINVNGCFWHLHGCPRCRVPTSRRVYWEKKLARNVARDHRNRRRLRRHGWHVMTIWECQLSAVAEQRLRARIVSFLSKD
ncbi:MAG: hypothetical protein ACREHD_09310 [Pirellulales bacterium]